MDKHTLLLDMIGVLARRWHQIAERGLMATGINHSEARLLGLLHQAGGSATQEELSAQLFIDRSNVGRALKGLEAGGHITRRKDDADKRAYQVQITAKGTGLVHEVARQKQAWQAEFFRDLPEKDAGAAVEILKQILSDEEYESRLRAIAAMQAK